MHDTCWRCLTALQRYSWCILKPSQQGRIKIESNFDNSTCFLIDYSHNWRSLEYQLYSQLRGKTLLPIKRGVLCKTVNCIWCRGSISAECWIPFILIMSTLTRMSTLTIRVPSMGEINPFKYHSYSIEYLVLNNKSWRQHPTKHQLYGHLPPITKTIQVRRTRHVGHYWRSRDELISDVLLWTPTYSRAKAGRPARTYIQQLCEDTGCSPEDLPEAMNDREKWRERVRDIRAVGMTWWWWWFVLRRLRYDIITWSSHYLLRIIISYLKPYESL